MKLLVLALVVEALQHEGRRAVVEIGDAIGIRHEREAASA